MKWRRTYRLWALQFKDPVGFEQFMGRKPVLNPEEKKQEFWEMIERDRQSANPKVTEKPDGSTAS
jgi:hypothetical protein